MFRVAELRKRHIIGAKVRVFCVRHERCPAVFTGGEGDLENRGNRVVELETAHFVSNPLPLLNGSHSTTSNRSDADEEEPNSECSFEQSILMGLPHVVVHRMDSLSPMMPPRPVWYDEGGVPHTQGLSNYTSSEAPTVSTAEESMSGENTSPPSLLAAADQGQSMSAQTVLHATQPTQEEISHFLQDRQAEIIVFLEGTCEVTGMALQARHSYRIEDIAFHQTFSPCVFPASSIEPPVAKKRWNPFAKNKTKVDQDSKPQGGSGEVYTFQGNAALEIDFSQFHDLQPTPHDSMSCPFIPSSALRALSLIHI